MTTQSANDGLLLEPLHEIGRAFVDLDRLPPNEALYGPEPTVDLLDSISQVGLMEPISIQGRTDERSHVNAFTVKYGDESTLISGRRRIKALRLLVKGCQDALAKVERRVDADEERQRLQRKINILRRVPVSVVIRSHDIVPIAGIVAHSTRHENRAQQLRWFEKLIREGYDPKRIATETGLRLPQVHAVLRLTRLCPFLRDLFDRGVLTDTPASEISNLPLAIQEELAELYRQTGKLRVQDIRIAKAARKNEAVNTFLDALGDDEGESPALTTTAAFRTISEEEYHALTTRIRELEQEVETLHRQLKGDAELVKETV